MNALSIRAKIAVACAGLTAATVASFAVGTLVNIYEESIEAADMEIASEARHVAEIMSLDDFSRERIQNTGVEKIEPWIAFAVIETDGSIWRSNGNLPDEIVRALVTGERPITVRHGGKSWRVQHLPIKGRTVVVSFDLAEVHSIVLDQLVAYVLALPLTGVVAGFGGWWVAGRALRPVRELTRAAEGIHAENLSIRVPMPEKRGDLARLTNVLNAMLDRLERSFRQAERFAADASHELRTPLTIMRGELESVLQSEALSPRAERKLVSVQEETDRLERITTNLLLLARFDAGADGFGLRSIDLSSVVLEACDDISVITSNREIVLEHLVSPNVTVLGDEDLMRRMVLNLLDNAAKFNSSGGRVSCVLDTANGNARLSVGNTGPGIPEALRGRLFERFFRADQARQRAGNGLGLALSREIARFHGGDLDLSESGKEGWTEFIAWIPQLGPN